MSNIINKFLLETDKFMSQMHLRQLGFPCGPFINNKTRIQKNKTKRDTRYICWNELDKACSQHDMMCDNFKDLPRRATSEKILRGKAFKIVSDPNYD